MSISLRWVGSCFCGCSISWRITAASPAFKGSRWLGVAKLFPPRYVFCLTQSLGDISLTATAMIYASGVFAVILPLKIWNNSRNEKKLELQQLRLNEAR